MCFSSMKYMPYRQGPPDFPWKKASFRGLKSSAVARVSMSSDVCSMGRHTSPHIYFLAREIPGSVERGSTRASMPNALMELASTADPPFMLGTQSIFPIISLTGLSAVHMLFLSSFLSLCPAEFRYAWMRVIIPVSDVCSSIWIVR